MPSWLRLPGSVQTIGGHDNEDVAPDQPGLLGTEELQTDVGPLLLPSGDQVMGPLIARTGDWELNEAILFRAHIERGATVVDVGAHVGYYTLLAARTTGPDGRVFALEPDPVNAELLRENVARNALDNVTVLEAAAWRETTRLWLERHPSNTGDHRIRPARTSGQGCEVDAIALDELLGQVNVAVVKVDTQGTDHIALEGMSRTLRRCSPVVFVEFWPAGIRRYGEDPKTAIDAYRRLGFRLTMPGLQADFDSWSPRDFVRAAKHLPGGFGTLVLRAR